MNVKGIINADRIKINDMRINKKTITTETKSGRTYVPPRIKLCPLDPESIMAVVGSPYIEGKVTNPFTIEGTEIPEGFEPAERPTMNTDGPAENLDVTGLQLFGN